MPTEYLFKSSQTKSDTLVLQVGVWAWGWQPHTVKIKLFRNPEEGQGSQRAVMPEMLMMFRYSKLRDEGPILN
jgi:hypothetical protein